MWFKFQLLLLLATCLAAFGASAEILEKNEGIKIGERLTLRPSVSVSLSYDSNVDSNSGRTSNGGSDHDFMVSISPQLWLHYNAETWSVILSGFYNYRHYFESAHRQFDHHDFGEDLRFNWANTAGREKGWSLVLGQSFHRITAADDMTLNDKSYDSDASQFQLSAALQRRFNERLHADVNASYYWLDYDNETRGQDIAYYGWSRWMVGAEAGYAASKWADFIVSGSAQGYDQDNNKGTAYSANSKGYSLQVGFASYMTERISYRLLGGWSRFEYADGLATDDGFVYTASANWKIGESWNTMLLASSYYQPSERQQSSHSRVDAISWGLAKMMVRGKLRWTLDLRYRHETNEYAGNDTRADWDYALDVWTGRIGLNYSLNRLLSCFAAFEYQKSFNDHASERRGAYDYDRWRLTGGFTLSY